MRREAPSGKAGKLVGTLQVVGAHVGEPISQVEDSAR
jgi:hypothetical protein